MNVADALSKSGQCSHFSIQFNHFVVVSVEELEKTRLRSRRTFHAAKTKIVASARHIPQVHEQIGEPQASPFADCRQLSRSGRKRSKSYIYIMFSPLKCTVLKMGVSESRKSLVRPSKRSQPINASSQL